jgi:hypothetical protein
MAKGSVRKKGKKWYYRFYVEDASGKMVQKEYAGTESKSETEKLLRKALEDYENKKFVAKADSLTVGELLDMWAEEELKKRQKDVETKKRTHRLCQIGGAVESVLGSAIEEDDIPKLIGFLKRQEANGKFFSKAMQKEPVANTEEV